MDRLIELKRKYHGELTIAELNEFKADYYRHMRDYRGAIDLLEKSISTQRNSGEHEHLRKDYFIIGKCYLDLKDQKQGLEFLDKTWNSSQSSPDLLTYDDCNLAWSYIKELKARGYTTLAIKRMKILCDRLRKLPFMENSRMFKITLGEARELCQSMNMQEEAEQMGVLLAKQEMTGGDEAKQAKAEILMKLTRVSRH